MALDRNPVVRRVREFLARMARKTSNQQAAMAGLEKMFRTTRIHVGPKTWTREDLHER
jgi:hypothetical protein